MDRQTDGRRHEQTDRCAHGHTDRQMNGQTDKQSGMNGQRINESTTGIPMGM